MGKVTVYLDDGSPRKFRWHRTVSSDIVSDSGQGYVEHTDAIAQAKANAQEGDTVVFRDPETGEENEV